MHAGVEPGDFFEACNHLRGVRFSLVARFQRKQRDIAAFGGAFNSHAFLARGIACGAQIVEHGERTQFIAGVKTRQCGCAFGCCRDGFQCGAEYCDFLRVAAV